VLVLILVAREGNGVTRAALLLQPPTDGGGRRGGRLWLWLVPFIVAFAAVVQFFPLDLPGPIAHSFGPFLDSPEGHDLLRGNWPLFALIVMMLAFNTALGEELLLRGLLLPRMRTAFGRWDWVVNGLLGGLYHLHQPWSIPSSIINHSLFAYASRRWQSTWMGIAIHSAQSVFFLVVMLVLVLS
jgi:membrane protease YdiL (CAAX protease family)